MRKFLKKPLVYLLATMMFFPTWIVTGLTNIQHAKAAIPLADHLVISEISFSSTTCDFIEIYNPTIFPLDLNGMRLVKRTLHGTSDDLLVSWSESTVIESDGYYLWGSNGCTMVNIDLKDTGSKMIADGNSIALRNGSSNTGTIVDAVAWGDWTTSESDPEDDGLFEGARFNPVGYNAAGKSLERLVDNNFGNYVDTDNNLNDFLIQDVPNPQGSGESTLFAQISAETEIFLDESKSNLTVKSGQDLDWTIDVNYPEALLVQVKDDYKVDAAIASTLPVPAGTKITLYYGETQLGDYNIVTDTTEILLSTIIEGINTTSGTSWPTRVKFNTEVDSSWRFVINGLPEGLYDLDFGVFIGKTFEGDGYLLSGLSESAVVDDSVAIPQNISATLKSDKNIMVNWNPVTDDLSGLAGYNLYSNEDNYLNPINPSLLTVNSFELISPLDGSYTFKVLTQDNAGNISALSDSSNTVVVDSTKPSAPQITATTLTRSDGKFINISWKGVGGYIEKYEIYVNGVTSADNTVIVDNLTDDFGVEYSRDIKVLGDGTYEVYVKVIKFSDYANSLIQSLEFVAPVVTPPVTETPAPVVTIAPQKAAAATEPQPTAVATTPDDSNGQIKGDEQSNESEESKINWTPWIVLFVLILLAGAATGGYFYWFNGEEEAKAAIPEPTKEAKAPKVAPVVTKSNSQKKPQKKSKRW